MASPGVDATVQIAPNSTGSLIDFSQKTVSGQTVLDQRVNIADPANDQVAGVDASGSLQVTVGGLSKVQITSSRAAGTCSQVGASSKRLFRVINPYTGQPNLVAIYDAADANGTADGTGGLVTANLLLKKVLGPGEVVFLDIPISNGIAVVPVTASLPATAPIWIVYS